MCRGKGVPVPQTLCHIGLRRSGHKVQRIFYLGTGGEWSDSRSVCFGTSNIGDAANWIRCYMRAVDMEMTTKHKNFAIQSVASKSAGRSIPNLLHFSFMGANLFVWYTYLELQEAQNQTHSSLNCCRAATRDKCATCSWLFSETASYGTFFISGWWLI